jgi:hypothetical protein
MPRVGFEPTIQVFERAKTVHDLDRTATVIGETCTGNKYFLFSITLGHKTYHTESKM